jgi:threonine aldolase
MNTIDLRSDTVTHPTPAMREAMANALVGDDVYGDDPTVNELQAYAADLLGKEAALYMPTATMSNTAAALTHCRRGDEIILSKKAHMFVFEQSGAAQLGGVSMYPLDIRFDGTMSLSEIEGAIRGDDPHFPRTALICLENTVHGAGATPITAEYTQQVGEIARRRGLKLHLDGARLFNAAAALKVQPRALAAPADSVQICLSKGLCAPLGSLLVGSREFIARALRTRKVLGGGMRQAGVVAAAGLIALRDMRERLVEDHRTAAQLAEGLATIEGITVEPVHMRTNFVLFSIPPSVNVREFVEAMKARNVILRGGPRFRAVTHYWITPERVQYTIDAMREVLAQQMGQTAEVHQ